jgi:hypothetical protein
MVRKDVFLIGLIALFGWCTALFAAEEIAIEVTNPSEDDWKEVPVVVKWTEQMEQLGFGQLKVVDPGGEDGVVQRDDLNRDGMTDEIVFLAELKAGENKTYKLQRRTSDELPEWRAHAGMYLRGLVGPAWESDVIAYRVYWNNHTAIDVFGKTMPILALEAYASPELNYHVESKYGLDVLKVGPALGVGGFGVWIDGKVWMAKDTMKTYHILANGPLRAVLGLKFVDWYVGDGKKDPAKAGEKGFKRRLDMDVHLKICAGQKWSTADLYINPVDPKPVPDVVTGVVRHEETKSVHNAEVGILGRWGRQALGDHEVKKAADLGLGVAVDPEDVIKYTKDDYNDLVLLKPKQGRISYRLHASWEKEPNGAKSAEDYKEMLSKVARKVPQVKVKK